MAKQIAEVAPVLDLRDAPVANWPSRQSVDGDLKWTKDICPNCGYANADVDTEGVLWCPACGHSEKGCYT